MKASTRPVGDSRYWRRLTFQWALLIVVLATPLTAVIVVLLYQLDEDSRSAAFRLVRTVVRGVDDDIRFELRRKEQLMAYLAARPALRAAVQGHCDPQFREMRRLDPSIANVLLVDTRGRLLCSALDHRNEAVSYADREWFRDGLQGKFGWGKPVLGHLTQRWVNVLTRDVRGDDGTLLGMLVIASSLEALSRMIAGIDLPDGSVATLVDWNGTVLARSVDPARWVGRNARGDEFVDTALAEGEGAAVLRGADGVPRFYGYISIADAGLHVTVGVPAQAAMAGHRKRLTSSVVAVALALLCAIAGAAVATRKILIPIRSVIDAAKAASSGNLEARAIAAGPLEIEELARQFNHMQLARTEAESALRKRSEQLEAANRELEAFSYSVSHDLRTPLRAIDGFGQRLLEASRDRLDPAATHYLNRIRAGTVVMAQLIDDLLNLSRVTRTSLQIQRVNLSDLVRRIAAGLRQNHPERAVELAVSPDISVEADARLLEIVVQNLMGNAWKFSANRELAHIAFGVATRDGETVYYFRDDGAGFDMAYADKLFAPFQRLHSAAEFPGTGIGLVTVQRIVHRHGGRVWVDAGAGQGATVFFTLGKGNRDVG